MADDNGNGDNSNDDDKKVDLMGNDVPDEEREDLQQGLAGEGEATDQSNQ